MRDAWPEVLASLQRTKRSAWMVAFTAQVRDFREGEVLVLGFPSEQDVAGFRGGAPGQSVSELLRSAINEVLGVTVKFIAKPQAAFDGAPPADGPGSAAPARPASTPGAPAGAASGGAPANAAGLARTERPGSGAAPSAKASGASAPPSTSTQASAATSVDSWATVAIPSDEPPAQEAQVEAARTARGGQAAASAAPTATATALAEAPVVAYDPLDDVPDEADAPPEDVEPPFDPGPVPDEIVVDAAPAASSAPAALATSSAPAALATSSAPARAGRTAAPRGASRTSAASAPTDGIQRYGESVVREVLGATFLEEVEAPGRTGFGERG
jgi:DNA polymerase-3 subunit gamma/tau